MIEVSSDRRERKPGRFVIRGLVALGILFLLLLAGARLHLRRQVRAELEQIRKAGEPVSMEDLNQHYHDFGGRTDGSEELSNAFFRVTAVLGRLTTNGIPESSQKIDDLPVLGNGPKPTAGQPLSPRFEDAVRSALTELAPALDELASVLNHTNRTYRYLADYQVTISTPLPYLTWMRMVDKCYTLRSAYELNQGNPDQAITTVIDTLRFSRTLEGEPNIISQLLRFAIIRSALDSLAHVLDARPINARQIAQLRQELDQARPHQAMHLALVGERCTGIDFWYSQVAPGVPNQSTSPNPMMMLYRMSGLADRDILFYLHTFNQAVNIATNELPTRLAMVNDPAVFNPAKSGRFMLYSRMLLPAIAKSVQKEAECLTQMVAADTALAVEAFRADHQGQLPANLKGLVPGYAAETPTDPSTGNPLALKVHTAGNGYSIQGNGPLFDVHR